MYTPTMIKRNASDEKLTNKVIQWVFVAVTFFGSVAILAITHNPEVVMPVWLSSVLSALAITLLVNAIVVLIKLVFLSKIEQKSVA